MKSQPTAKTLQQLKRINEALLVEKQEDRERFKAILEQYSLEKKKEKGLALHPFVYEEEGYMLGDYSYVVLQYHGDKKDFDASQIRSGQPIEILSISDETTAIQGTIHYIRKEKFKIILSSDAPDWIYKGKLILQSVFDERTYIEMEQALKRATQAKGRYAELLNYFYSTKEYKLEEQKDKSSIFPHLNSSQNNAIHQIVSANDIAVVHGPPGTGKTTTIVHAIESLVSKNRKILVCAPSNAAVDVVTLKLVQKGLKVLRIGNISRVEEEVLNSTLDGILEHHDESKRIKDVRKEAQALKKKALKYKRNFGKAEREERNQMMKEYRELLAWASRLEYLLIESIVQQSDIILSTFVNANHKLLNELDFDYVIIDEAGQGIDPGMLIAIERGEHIVLAGDPYQLPPTVKSKEAESMGLSKNILESWIEEGKPSQLLNVQYRMHHAIMNFSNQVFYNGELRAADQVTSQQLSIENNQAIEFVDTAGCGFEEASEEENKSKFNEGEVGILREHLMQLIHDFENHNEVLRPIAILSPYRAQVRKIQEEIENDVFLSDYEKFIKVDSIDAFQGGERDIVYLSLVRSNDRSEIGFLKDYRRMNVALTRAKFKMIVIGDSATIGADSFYGKWIDFIEANGFYKTAWEYFG